MSEIKLFRVSGNKATEVQGKAASLEKSLQVLLESNLEAMLGVRFLRSEYSTGKTHAGRIDTLGIDENDCPVIIEYKKAINENVINQGLFYLDWLLDHKAEFQLLVQKKFGAKLAEAIDWSGPRLLCVAADFTKYDEHAVKQMGRNVELVRYRRFGDDLLALDIVYRASGIELWHGRPPKGVSSGGTDKTVADWLKDMSPAMRDLYDSLRSFLLAMGDDVTEKQLKLYVAFRRIKNFACVSFSRKALSIYLKLDPGTVKLEQGFTRDVSTIGHWGTGNLEVVVKDAASLQKAQPLLQRAYEEA
jgi:predicted transport protein